jgi:hypothetical protein
LILLETTSPHPFRNQTSLVLGYGPSDLQEQLIVWILAHGMIDKLNQASASFQFFYQEHLMHIVACQSVGCSDHHAVKFGTSNLIPQTIKSWSSQTSSAVAIIAKNVVVTPPPVMRLAMETELF